MSGAGQQGSSKAPQITIMAGAVVCNGSEISGCVTIGPRTVIHPRAKILAEAGPIVIGENNLIEEQAQIIHRQASGAPENVMVIGANNVFEVDSYSEAPKIGDNNVLEAKAKIGPRVQLTNGCIIGACCEVTAPEIIPDNTVIYGSECERRVQSDRPAAQTLQLDFLMKILPNYHYILKKTKKEVKSQS